MNLNSSYSMATMVNIANSEIPAATQKTVLIYKSGETKDIVREVLACYKDSRHQLARFSPNLKCKTVEETCKNIWLFWKENIRYKVDKEGGQWVKTPAAVWSEKACDCKSFSVAVACTLYALGIAGKFRFVSFGNNKTAPTHVYVVAMNQGKEIIIDCVWKGFNSQKSYAKKWDHNMTQIFRVSGLDTMVQKGALDIDVNDNTVTEAEMDLALNKQQLELEQLISRKKHAVGSVVDNAYQTEIEAHNAALGSIGKTKKGGAKLPPMRKSPNNNKKINKAVKVNKKQAKILTKASVTIAKRKDGLLKRVAKGITKAVSTPLRLAAKTQLPRNAPFFLYLFITDAKVIASLPDVVVQKRQKALNFKKVLVDKLQMKESNFTTTIRSGIINSFGKSPEAVLASWMKDWKKQNNIAGVLEIGLKAAGGGLKALLSKLGANITDDLENFTPAPEDWGVVSDEVKADMARDVQAQSENNDPEQGKGSVRPLDDEGRYAVKTMNNAPNRAPQNEDDNTPAAPPQNDGTKWEDSDTDHSVDPKGDTDLKQSKNLEEVIIKAGKAAKPESDNTMLYLGVGAVALLALAGGKKRK